MGSDPNTISVDALIVGAGYSGIYSTYTLSNAGLRVQTIDVASDVGGTWYWNTYPGAMSDTESYVYRYSWDKEDLQTYPWTHHYVYQAEILEYLRHVTKKHDLYKYMRFNTELQTAVWDDELQHWVVSCSDITYHARYLFTCLGLLSKPNYPDIAGISSFDGAIVHTARWDKNLDLKGKKVGIIGNGSTGVQVMTAIAPEVGHLTSFQRHPQYSVPSGQGPIPEGYREKINENYDQIWDGVWNSSTAFGVPEVKRKTMEATPEERRKAFQSVWDQGNGFRFMFSAFGDITTSVEANEEACKFVRSKIDEVVKNPKKAQALKPRELYARRPLCDSGYYQIFNRDNVDIVDLRETSIEQIIPEGIRTTDGNTHKLDVLIFATGFDAIEGNYLRIQIKGRHGKTIKKHWADGATAFGSIACSGFPNMFLIGGPQGAFANFPPVIEAEINFATACVVHSQTNGNHIMEVSAQAEQQWSDHCEDLVAGSLFKSADSWWFGTNIKGRKPRSKFYFGGLNRYCEWVQREIKLGFPGFEGTRQIPQPKKSALL